MFDVALDTDLTISWYIFTLVGGYVHCNDLSQASSNPYLYILSIYLITHERGTMFGEESSRLHLGFETL